MITVGPIRTIRWLSDATGWKDMLEATFLLFVAPAATSFTTYNLKTYRRH